MQLANALSEKQVYVAIAAEDGGTLSYQGTYDRSPISGVVTTPGETVNFAVDPASYVTVLAIAEEGYVFASWTIAGQVVSTANPYYNQVENAIGTDATPLTANFAPQLPVPEYPLAGLAAILSCFGALVVFKKRDSLVPNS